MSDKPLEDQAKRILDLAVETRKFEISLFWQRSLFFWGFIAAAFVAYAAVSKDDAGDFDLRLTIAAFGLIYSVAWTLANRGSKYWQSAWEAKLETVEPQVLGFRLFDAKYAPRKSDLYFLGTGQQNGTFQSPG